MGNLIDDLPGFLRLGRTRWRPRCSTWTRSPAPRSTKPWWRPAAGRAGVAISDRYSRRRRPDADRAGCGSTCCRTRSSSPARSAQPTISVSGAEGPGLSSIACATTARASDALCRQAVRRVPAPPGGGLLRNRCPDWRSCDVSSEVTVDACGAGEAGFFSVPGALRCF